jgi:hypothetical protein
MDALNTVPLQPQQVAFTCRLLGAGVEVSQHDVKAACQELGVSTTQITSRALSEAARQVNNTNLSPAVLYKVWALLSKATLEYQG